MCASENGRHSEQSVMRPFRAAVESTGHSIYWTDTTGTIEYVNPAFEEQTGFSAEEAVGSNASILQSGAHGDLFYGRLWDTILSGDVWKGEIVNERKNGERYVAKQTISPITDDAGDIIRFVAVNEDVSDLREAQKRVERERNRFADLFDAVPIPLVLTYLEQDEAVIKQANQAFQDKFGFTGRELGGASLDQLLVDDADTPEAHEINDRLTQGERVRREVTRQAADDESRTFILNATPLDGERDELLATYIDITDRKQLEDELRDRTEELQDFANVVSHDLRNPLNVAKGHVELIAAESDNPQLERIQNAHARMEELIENILMLASQGKTVDETEPVSLDDCVSRTWKTVATQEADLEIETERTVAADENRLRQLFGNLLRNAIEHGGNDVTITVGDLEDGFYVADDGSGIPVEERPHVFKAGHTSAETGTGLGLSIVKEIVDAHDWAIDVTESSDGGARFEITGVQ
ncbi:PAS domain S-box protein [Halobacterium salinarum]|uniref:PAS domain S-box protein n=2 Tax=Halobacterium salinarum TaxID=2242 RepID=UPI00390493BD